MDEFAVLILTHGRADNVRTYATLRRFGYTGRIYLVVDNEDKQLPKYIENYGQEAVLVFDKRDTPLDLGDNKFDDRRTVLYARNASFDLARGVGLKYFMQLDDDYTAFLYRFGKDYMPVTKYIRSMDAVLATMLEFFKGIPADSIAMAQGGDFIGGSAGGAAHYLGQPRRKCMNSFLCSVDRQFPFVGRLNDDVNTYVVHGQRGRLFFTIGNVSLNQMTTQTNPGGLTEAYLDSGTYVKSFYTVMMSPASVKVGLLGPINWRIHHSINWRCTVPKIVSEELRRQ